MLFYEHPRFLIEFYLIKGRYIVNLYTLILIKRCSYFFNI